MKLNRLTALVAILSFLTVGIAFAGKDLDAVQQKGFVQAGVNGGVFGFGMPDEKGVWKGLDVDTARAVAAAVFGDASKVKYTPLTAQQRFTALQSGEIDVLTRNATRTLSRETQLGRTSSRSTITTGRASWCRRSSASKAPRTSAEQRSAFCREQPPSRMPPTTSVPTT